MKKLLAFLLIVLVASFAAMAIGTKSIGPPGLTVPSVDVAPISATVVAMDGKAINGITLAGTDLAMRAGLDAIAIMFVLAAIFAVVWTIFDNLMDKPTGDNGAIGYHARDQSLA